MCLTGNNYFYLMDLAGNSYSISISRILLKIAIFISCIWFKPLFLPRVSCWTQLFLSYVSGWNKLFLPHVSGWKQLFLPHYLAGNSYLLLYDSCLKQLFPTLYILLATAISSCRKQIFLPHVSCLKDLLVRAMCNLQVKLNNIFFM